MRSEKIWLKLGFFTVFEFSLPSRAQLKSRCKTERASSVQTFHDRHRVIHSNMKITCARATPTTTDRNNLVKWYHVDRTRRRRRVVYLSNHQQSSFVSVSGSSLLNIICIFITFILLFRHRNAIASRRRQCSFLLRSLISLSRMCPKTRTHSIHSAEINYDDFLHTIELVSSETLSRNVFIPDKVAQFASFVALHTH